MSATVIVPSWNGAQRLQRLLPTLGTDSEVVVVDNGSTDGTADLLARRFPQVEIMRLARNHGFSKAINRAAEVASSDAIVLVNDDCVCEQGFAERLARALDAASGVHDEAKRARMLADEVRTAMTAAREASDLLEHRVADDRWGLPKYREMLFVR